MASISEVSKALATFRLFFPNFNPENIAASAKAWHELIGHFPGDELQAACSMCCAEPGRVFAPSVGEIVGAVMKLRAQASGIPSASEAWEQINERERTEHVHCEIGAQLYSDIMKDDAAAYPKRLDIYSAHYRECVQCGIKHIPPVVHPAAELVARQFGWPGRFPGDNPEADRAHFMRAYDAEIKRETERQAQPVQVQKYIESKSVAGAVAALAEGMRK